MNAYKEYISNFDTLNNDLTPSTDEVLYSNTRALEIYSQGKRFTIEDNLIFYEIVKMVKDVIDKHNFQPQVQWVAQIANKEVTFTFIIDKKDIRYSYFVETLYQYIANQVYRVYGSKFIISKEDQSNDNNVILKINIKTNNEQD